MITVDLSVSGVELTEGEGPEGKRESNRCTYFSHVRPCTLPAIGELPCRVLRGTLEYVRAISGRCKTRAKMRRPSAAFAHRPLQVSLHRARRYWALGAKLGALEERCAGGAEGPKVRAGSPRAGTK